MLKNNNPVHTLTNQERLRGASKRTQKKRWAARLRELRRKGELGHHETKLLIEMIEEKESFALEIIKSLISIREECTTINHKILVSNAFINVMRCLHGENIKSVNIQPVVNWNEVFVNCVVEDDQNK